MDAIMPLIDAARANPLVAGGVVAGLLLGYFLLQRKPRMQREADQRLSALRRDRADLYTRERPPR